jgi:hypothetical protein
MGCATVRLGKCCQLPDDWARQKRRHRYQITRRQYHRAVIVQWCILPKLDRHCQLKRQGLRERVAYTRSLLYLATIGYTSRQMVDRTDVATHLTDHSHAQQFSNICHGKQTPGT